MRLLEETERMLSREISVGTALRVIAPDGGDVEYEWLKKFSAGKISHPSVVRIQALHDRLASMQRKPQPLSA